MRGSAALRGWLLCLPAILVFGVFFIGPVVIGVVVSLNEWNGSSPTMTFVGLNNYMALLGDRRFVSAVAITLAAFLGMVAIKLPLALLVAAGLASLRRGARFYRMAVFLPYVLSTTTVAIIWIFLLDPYQGLVNQVFKRTGLAAFQQGWLGQASTALPSVVAGGVWWTFGLYVVIFTAGMAGIPRDYYDAARIETRSSMKILWYVTVPLLREQIFTSAIMIIGGVIGYMTGFILLLTGGGPSGRTETLGILSYSLAFRGLEFGRASAVSILVLIMVFCLVIGPTVRIARTRLEYR